MALLVGCGGDEASNAPEPRSGIEPPVAGETPTEAEAAPESEPPAPPPSRVHVDLLALDALVDIDHGGLFMDFGTRARAKYTNGEWNSGWGSDRAEGDVTFTRFGRMGRVYFDVREAVDSTLRIRLKPVGSTQLLPFMNGEPLAEQTLVAGTGFVVLDIPVPAARLRAGENYLLLRSNDHRRVDGEDASFAVESIRFAGGSIAEGEWAAPRLADIVAETTVSGDSRGAFRVEAPTTLTFHVEVPAEAHLVFGAAAVEGDGARVALRIQPEGGTGRELWAAALTDGWNDQRIDLADYADKIVRLEVVATGAGVAAVSGLRVEVPAPPVVSAPRANATNVVVLVIDTLRSSKLRPYNPRSRVRMPAFDGFAEAGALYESAQSPENWTKPAVASILTSLHPATHGAKNDGSRLPASALMLSEALQARDFETGSFIANGYVSSAFGFGQGWDHYTNYIREERNTNARNVFGEAIEWIEENREAPFFAYIQTIDPHVPYDPPDEFLELYDSSDYSGQVRNRRTHLLLEEAKRRPPTVTFDAADQRRIRALYDGELSYHDRHFGRFLERFAELGLAENTIFIVTSDHGEEFNDHGSWGHGHSVYQELLHVPLVIRWPGVVAGGTRVASVVSTLDIAPTVFDALGLTIPSEFEGRSLLGHAVGTPPPGPYVAFSDFQENRRVVRAGPWKLIIRSNLTYTMFDLARDPGEENQLTGREHPIAMRYLRQLSGHFLGATNRRDWLGGGATAARLNTDDVELSLEICEQMSALGYNIGGCDALINGAM